MTVIAYRDGIVAADTGVWADSMLMEHRSKIVRLTDGRLYAASGAVADVEECRAWLDGEGERPAPCEPGQFGAVVVGPDRRWRIDHRFRLYDVTASRFLADGAHNEFLLGAMAAGATAADAVRLAIQWGDSAAGDVHAMCV